MLQISTENVPVRNFALWLAVPAVLLYYTYAWITRTKFDAPLEGDYKYGQGSDYAAMNADEVLEKSYPKYRNRFFKIPEAHGETVLLPSKYLDELQALPEKVLSFEAEFVERTMGDLSLMSGSLFGNHGRTFPTSISVNLAKNLGGLMPVLQEECDAGFKNFIGSCDDWTEVNVMEKLIGIISMMSGRLLIGPEMYHNPEYMKHIIHYTLEVFTAVGALQEIHPWLRYIYAKMGWIPALNQALASFESMQKLIEPQITQRLEALRAGEEMPQDFLSWNIQNSPEAARNIKAQAQSQLLASVAAIHTTTMTGWHILYDLASRPEYIEPLREELATVKVPLSKADLPKLKLMDSFFKESQRMNPLRSLSFIRRVDQKITLHDGTVLPKGLHLAVPTAQRTADPEVYNDPANFDPWRFYQMRQAPGEKNKHQFVSTSPNESLPWGYGTFACPGRFLADAELKMIMAYVLTNYEIKMPEGEGRPKNLATAGGTQPNVSKCMLMKQRET